ncbi:MAG: hypothetical protein JWM93_447, partial [Frankiales bacterium]|nr:hypothetical protein [Frankiales bacterium]
MTPAARVPSEPVPSEQEAGGVFAPIEQAVADIKAGKLVV